MRISDWSSDVCSSDLEPRASTTDPDARVMKMADGGFRQAYNVQVISATGTPIVVDVPPATTGSDRGLPRPGLERQRRRFRRLPERYPAHRGFPDGDAYEWAHTHHTDVLLAPLNSQPRPHHFCPAPPYRPTT